MNLEKLSWFKGDGVARFTGDMNNIYFHSVDPDSPNGEPDRFIVEVLELNSNVEFCST